MSKSLNMNSQIFFGALLLLSVFIVYSCDARRIIGGHEVKIENYPWQASLMNIQGHFCGGVIIDRIRILTAAHCLSKTSDDADLDLLMRIRVGSSNRTSGGILCKLRKVIVHSEYQKPTLFDNDIAVVVLKYRLHYTLAIRPILLPALNSDLPENSTVFISGWGHTYKENDTPMILNAVSLPIVDRNVCYKTYKNLTIAEEQNARVTDNMICAGLFGIGGKDSCQGDSGGPLVEITSTKATLHGIVSWGYGCAKPEYPGVYTRVSKYIEWIKQVR